MKSTDKFLIGIVAGIILLVVVVFAVALTRPEPTYQSDETASGVVHNYLLAVQREDYERAYSYLSPRLDGYPTSVYEFIEQLETYDLRFRAEPDMTLAVDSERVVGGRTVVTVRETQFYEGGLFNSRQSTNTFAVKTQLEGDTWHIVGADRYFAPCWQWDDKCD